MITLFYTFLWNFIDPVDTDVLKRMTCLLSAGQKKSSCGTYSC